MMNSDLDERETTCERLDGIVQASCSSDHGGMKGLKGSK